MLERKAEMERRLAASGENNSSDDVGATSNTARQTDAASSSRENFITGVDGSSLRLTDEELRDPAVRSKYQQLAEAKKRLGKMEEVMMMIAEAQRKGQSINEALSPEYLAILEDAKVENFLCFSQLNSYLKTFGYQ